jgi:hypothetical protein
MNYAGTPGSAARGVVLGTGEVDVADGTRTKLGTATATVVCGSASAPRTFQFVR